MSIYSGFPTRKDQSNYNHLLLKLIQTLQTHLLQVLQTHSIPMSKTRTYEKIITRMREYEVHKYLEPKFSQIVNPIAQWIGLPDKVLEIIPEYKFSRVQTPHNNDKNKSQTSHSHSVINSKKGSHFVSLQEEKEKAKSKESKEHLWQTKTKVSFNTPKNISETRNSRASSKKNNYHQSFYALHERRLSKMNNVYARKSHQQKSKNEHVQLSQGKDFGKYRSEIEPQPSFPLQNPREYCIDLKVLKEAEHELRKAENHDKFYDFEEDPSRQSFK